MSGFNTPTSTHAVQSLMRANPEVAFAKYGFPVVSTVYQNGVTGGPCAIGCEDLGNGIYRLTAKQGNGDFLFPYVNTAGGGVGSCLVPILQSEGTIVVTGPMNGCSLHVYREAGQGFRFYHDLNGESLTNPPPGVPVCRVDKYNYMGPKKLDIGGRMVAEHHESRGGGNMLDEYHLITILRGGRWEVYCSALLRTTVRTENLIWWDSTNISYKSFVPTVYARMASFDNV